MQVRPQPVRQYPATACMNRGQHLADVRRGHRLGRLTQQGQWHIGPNQPIHVIQMPAAQPALMNHPGAQQGVEAGDWVGPGYHQGRAVPGRGATE